MRSLRRAVLDTAIDMLSRLHEASPPPCHTSAAPPHAADSADAAPPPRTDGGEQFRASVLNSWANINRPGHSNLFHDHPQVRTCTPPLCTSRGSHLTFRDAMHLPLCLFSPVHSILCRISPRSDYVYPAGRPLRRILCIRWRLLLRFCMHLLRRLWRQREHRVHRPALLVAHAPSS